MSGKDSKNASNLITKNKTKKEMQDIALRKYNENKSRNKSAMRHGDFAPARSYYDILRRNVSMSNLDQTDKQALFGIMAKHFKLGCIYEKKDTSKDMSGDSLDEIYIEMTQALRDFMNILRESLDVDSMKVIARLETLILTLYLIWKNKDDLGNASLILIVYLKTHFPDYSICDLFGLKGPQTNEKEGHDQIGGLSGLNEVRLFLTSDLVKNLSYCISLLVTMNLVQEQVWSYKGFKIFHAKALSETDTTGNIIEQLYSVLKYFFEIGYQCFETRSAMPLWNSFGNDSAFETEMNDIVINTHAFLNGSKDIDPADIDFKIKKVIKVLQDKLKYVHSGDKMAYSKRLSQFMQLDDDIATNVVNRGLRVAPFCIKVYGKSGVGKTTFNNISLSEVLRFNNKRVEIERIQPELPFWENYKASATGIILDDLCNTPHTKSHVSPSELMISLMGNYPYAVNRAAIEDKCKVYVHASVVGITTNNESLDAHHYSVEPMSVLRRCHIHVTVKVKREYANSEGQLDEEKVSLVKGNHLIKDIWDIDVKRAVFAPGRALVDTTSVSLEIVVWKGQKLENIDIYTYLDFLYYKSSTHFAQQANLLETAKSYSCISCPTCFKICELCKCPSTDQMGFGMMGGIIASHYGKKYYNYVCDKVDNIALSMLDIISPSQYELYLVNAVKRWYINKEKEVFSADRIAMRILDTTLLYTKSSMSFLPRWMIGSEAFKYGMVYLDYKTQHQKNETKLRRIAHFLGFAALGGLYITLRGGTRQRQYGGATLCLGSLFTIPAFTTGYRIMRAKRISCEIEEVLKNRTLEALTDEVREKDKRVSIITGVFVGAALGTAALAMVSIIKRLMTNMVIDIQEKEDQTPHGGVNSSMLDPQTDDDIKERNNAFNPWKLDHVGSSHVDNRTAQQLLNTIFGNQVYIEIYDNTNKYSGFMNGLFLTSRLFMMPAHGFMKKGINDEYSTWRDSVNIKIYRSNNIKHAVTIHVTLEEVYQLPNTDCIMFPIDACGTFKNLLEFFPETSHFVGPYLVQKRDKCGNPIINSGGIIAYKQMRYTRGELSYDYPGAFLRNATQPFLNGDCFSVFVSDCKNPHILGLHLRGWVDDPLSGAAFSPTRAILIDAMSQFDRKYVEHSASPDETHHYGRDLHLVHSVHEKSPVNFIDTGNMRVLGTVPGGTTMKSEVHDSILLPHLSKHLGPQQWQGPMFRGPNNNQPWKPWRDSLVHLSNPSVKLNRRLLSVARADYITGLKRKLSLHSNYIRPLNWDETINGIKGSRFISRINLNTSMGYPLTGTKRKHMYIRDVKDDHLIYDFNDGMVYTEHNRIKSKYLNNQQAGFIFKASLKDEPTKIGKEKVRVFQGMPIAAQMVTRSLYLPLLSFLSLEPLLSECAVGINPFSREWDTLHHHICKFGEERIVAGDYAKWDMRLPAGLVMEAFDILIELAEETGHYSSEDIKIMYGLAFDISNPTVNYNGTIIQFHGSNPSGQNLTAHLNSICNSLVQRMAFYSMNDHSLSFRDSVSTMTYGDDFESSVRLGVNYDHILLRDFCAKELDIVLTMPNKTDVATPYMRMQDVDFLKRKSVFNNDLGVYIGQLDLNSIHKSLYTSMASSSMEKLNCVAVVESAIHELFYHGRDIFGYYRTILLDSMSVLGLIAPQLFLSYDERVNMWHAKYNKKRSYAKLSLLDDTPQEAMLDDDLQSNLNLLDPDNKLPTPLFEPKEGSWFRIFGFTEKEQDYIGYDLTENRAFNMPNIDQSGGLITPEGTKGSVVQFSVAQTNRASIGSYSDETFRLTRHQNDSNIDVLKRPVEIISGSWKINQPTAAVKFDPLWSMIDNSELVRNRVNYYAYISGRMCVKVLVNGSPFHYGKAILAARYWPGVTGHNFLSTTQLSCLPYISLNPTDATGGEMSLPLLHPNGKTSLYKREPVITCELRSFTPLKAIGETLDDVTYSIWVWFEDYELHMPTHGELDMMGDEYEKPLISTAATATSTFFGNFRNWPVIGPYARASEIVFGAGAKIAQLFGYSKPSLIQAEQHIQDMGLGNLANFNNKDSCVKLALDCKNEVTIDTNVTGYSTTDDMILTEMTNREGYLTTFDWDPIKPPRDFLWNAAVNPTICFIGGEPYFGNFYDRPEFTPVGYTSAAFKYWRGSMKFRFEIIASQFHKGKIRICYDPVKVPVPNMANEDNKVYSRVIDIATERNVVMDIGWGSAQNYLEVWNPEKAEQVMSADPGVLATRYGAFNGYIYVTVVNPLTCVESGPISVNVYMSGGSDFELQEPTARILAAYTVANTEYESSVNTAWRDQMGDAMHDMPVTLSADNIVDGSQAPTYDILGDTPELSTTDKLSLIHFGERIVSLRQLLKRYCVHSHITALNGDPGTVQSCHVDLQLNDFPYYCGIDILDGLLESNLGRINLSSNANLLNWFTPCFLMRRGSVRNKFILLSDGYPEGYNVYDLFAFRSRKLGVNREKVLIRNIGSTEGSYLSDLIEADYDHAIQGASVVCVDGRQAVEVELPFYSPKRWFFGHDLNINREWSDANINPSELLRQQTFFRLGFKYLQRTPNGPLAEVGSDPHFCLRRYTAAGDDFSLQMFMFPPTVVKFNHLTPEFK